MSEINYEWDFEDNSLKVIQIGNMVDCVYSIHWHLKATLGDSIWITDGDIEIPAPDPNNFIPFADLTKSQVIEWVESAMPQEVLDHYKQVLSDKVNDGGSGYILNKYQRQPKIPWVTE